MSLLELRLQIATARMNVRTARDAYELAKAEAEQRAIDAGVNGKNEAERSRNFALALSADMPYQHALRQYRQAEYEADRVEALLEAACDDRRNSEWQIRARLADALIGAHVFGDNTDPSGDGAFDSALDHAMLAGLPAHR